MFKWLFSKKVEPEIEFIQDPNDPHVRMHKESYDRSFELNPWPWHNPFCGNSEGPRPEVSGSCYNCKHYSVVETTHSELRKPEIHSKIESCNLTGDKSIYGSKTPRTCPFIRDYLNIAIDKFMEGK